MKLLIQYLMLFCILIIGVFKLNVASAETELENAALARVITVLNSLEPLLEEAERQQDKNTRVQFQYDALRDDLNKIKKGIRAKLNLPSIEPRKVMPVQGDYLSFRGKHS